MDKINLQLYSFSMDSPFSLLKKIKCAAELGFTGVEFAGGYEDIPVNEMLSALQDSNLSADSAHVVISNMERDIPYLAKLGVKRVICPMANFNSEDEARELAADLNRFGKIAGEYGMKTGYHNHTNEFYKVGGKYLYDYLIEYSDPSYVEFQLDCGWASAAGVDPVTYINSHAGNICSIHIKENGGVIGAQKPSSRYDKPPFEKMEMDENGKPMIPPEFVKMMEERERLNVPQGTGLVDWSEVKAAADAQKDHVIYVVEREANYGGKDRITCLKEDIAWIKKNL